MFREMRRFKQQIGEEKCIQLLKEQPRGVLSMIGDNDYPYGIPLDHWYSEDDHKLYYHCAKVGHKINAISLPSRLVFRTFAMSRNLTPYRLIAIAMQSSSNRKVYLTVDQ